MTSALSAADFERLRSWMITIAETLLPGIRTRDEGIERRFLGQGGFTVNRRTGAWYSHSAGRGGFSAPAMIEFLGNYTQADAIQWALAWLDSHDGDGECAGSVWD